MKELSTILTTDSSAFRARVCLYFCKKEKKTLVSCCVINLFNLWCDYLTFLSHVLHNTRTRTAQFEYVKDWIKVKSSEKGYQSFIGLLSFYMSVLKENVHLTIKLSIRYREYFMESAGVRYLRTSC